MKRFRELNNLKQLGNLGYETDGIMEEIRIFSRVEVRKGLTDIAIWHHLSWWIKMETWQAFISYSRTGISYKWQGNVCWG